MSKKQKECTHPDCFTCPYPDCIFEQMTIKDYLESKKRDKEYADPKPPREYKQRSYDCSGRKEYWRKYYQENREHHIRVCMEYQKRTGTNKNKDRSKYDREYYQKHREKRIQQVIERRKRIQEAINATG